MEEEEDLSKIVRKRLTPAQLEELQKNGVKSKTDLIGLTPRKMENFSNEARKATLKFLERYTEYYSLEDIIDFLQNLFGHKVEQEQKNKIEEYFGKFEHWNDVMSDLKEIEETFEEEKRGIREFTFIISDIDSRSSFSEEEFDLPTTIEYLELKKLAFDRRIPLKNSIKEIRNKIKELKLQLEKENIKREYSNRIFRKNMSQPPASISLKIPKTMEEIPTSKIMEFNEEYFTKFIENFPKDNYNIVSFIGKVGAGKSLFIRSAISSIEPYAPQSNFRDGGTTVDIRCYKTSIDVMRGNKYPSSPTSQSNRIQNPNSSFTSATNSQPNADLFGSVILFDTEGTDASSRNGEENISSDVMNKCLQSILPLTHLISTVVVFVVSEDNIRHDTFEKEIKRFKNGVEANEYRRPALIILVNKSLQDSSNVEEVIQKRLENYKEMINDCFHSMDFFICPALEITENTISFQSTKKIREFYELLISKIIHVNHANEDYLKSMLKFDSITYIPLISQICDSLPRAFDERRFWSIQIHKRLQLDSSPASYCMNYILHMENIYKKNIQLFSKLNENNNLEKIFISYCILDIINKRYYEHEEEEEGKEQEDLESQLKFFIEHHAVIKNSYRTLYNYVLHHVPCGEIKDGENCIVPYHSHRNFHKYRVHFFKVRKVGGNFKPMFQIPEAINLSLCREIINNAREPSSGVFSETRFFKGLMDLMISHSEERLKNKSNSLSKVIVRNIPKSLTVSHSKKFLNNYSDSSNLCSICFKDINEYFFSCGNSHSMCEKCLDHFKALFRPKIIERDEEEDNLMCCPFCFSKKKVTACHIRHILEVDRSIVGQFKIKELENSITVPESSLYVISVIGNITNSQYKELNEILKVTHRPPSAFVQFVQCCRAIKHWCMFTDNRLAIVYYFCKSNARLSKDDFDRITNFSSTNTIYIDDPNFTSKDYWHSKFYNLLIHDNPNLPENDPRSIEIDKLENFYSRAMWHSIMNNIVFSKIGNKIEILYFNQLLNLSKFYNSIDLKFISTNKLHANYFMKIMGYIGLELFLRSKHALSKAQIVNSIRITFSKFFIYLANNKDDVRYSGINYTKIEALQFVFESFWITKYDQILDHPQQVSSPKDDKSLLIQGEDEFLRYEDLSLLRIATFHQSKIAGGIRNFFVHKQPEGTKKRQRIVCYLCFQSFHFKYNLGCDSHPVCKYCWKMGICKLVESQFTELPKSQVQIISTYIFSVIPLDDVFKCFVCKSFLFNSFTKYIKKNEKKGFNLSTIISSMVNNDIENPLIISIGNRPNAIVRRDYIIQEQLQAYRYLPLCKGIWVDENRNSFPLAINEIITTNNSLLSSVEIAALFSSLPFFQKFYGVQLNAAYLSNANPNSVPPFKRTTSVNNFQSSSSIHTTSQNQTNMDKGLPQNPAIRLVCFHYEKNAQSLSQRLRESPGTLNSIELLTIIIQISRALRILFMCGIYWKVQTNSVIIPKEKILLPSSSSSPSLSSSSPSPSSPNNAADINEQRGEISEDEVKLLLSGDDPISQEPDDVKNSFLVFIIQLILRSLDVRENHYYRCYMEKINSQYEGSDYRKHSVSVFMELYNDKGKGIKEDIDGIFGNATELIENISSFTSFSRFIICVTKIRSTLIDKKNRGGVADNNNSPRNNQKQTGRLRSNSSLIDFSYQCADKNKETFIDEDLYAESKPCVVVTAKRRSSFFVGNSASYAALSPSARFRIGENKFNVNEDPNNNSNNNNNSNSNTFGRRINSSSATPNYRSQTVLESSHQRSITTPKYITPTSPTLNEENNDTTSQPILGSVPQKTVFKKSTATKSQSKGFLSLRGSANLSAEDLSTHPSSNLSSPSDTTSTYSPDFEDFSNNLDDNNNNNNNNNYGNNEINISDNNGNDNDINIKIDNGNQPLKGGFVFGTVPSQRMERNRTRLLAKSDQ